MNEPDWTTHITSGNAWRRFGLMVAFAPILACVGCIIAFTALFQFFNVLAQGEPSPQLGRNGRELGDYSHDIISFLTYNSDKPPFPFAAEEESEKKAATVKTGSEAVTTRKKTTARKKSGTPRKKTTTRKKTGTTRKKTSTQRTTTASKTTSKTQTSETRPAEAESRPEQPDTTDKPSG